MTGPMMGSMSNTTAILRTIRANAQRIARAAPRKSPIWYGARNLADTCAVGLTPAEYAPGYMTERESESALRCAAGVAMVAWARSMAVSS
jgi:hypothetical protein